MGKDEDREPTTELAKTDDTDLLMRPVAPIKALLEAQAETVEFIKKGLHRDTDYGSLPGSDREVLFKAGAERLCSAFGVSAEYEITEQEIDHDRKIVWTKRKKKWYTEDGRRRFNWEDEHGDSLGFYRYVVAVKLTSRETGALLGTGIGVCSTMESKYIDRPRELENTILKMAQKRAMVGAALNVFCLSDRFTQDMEESAESEAVAKEPDAEAVYGEAGKMTTDQAKAWAMVEVELSEDDFNVFKDNAAAAEVSWLAVCRNARLAHGEDVIPENLTAELEKIVDGKHPPKAQDQTEQHGSGEASAPSGGAGQPATETGAGSPAEPAATTKPEPDGPRYCQYCNKSCADGRECDCPGAVAWRAESKPANWLKVVVSRETYVELRSKAADAGVDAQEFIDDALAETDDADTAELRFSKWLNTAKAKKAGTDRASAAQDARGGA